MFIKILPFNFYLFTYIVPVILLSCLLYSIRYTLYEQKPKKAGKFQKNLHDSPHLNSQL